MALYHEFPGDQRLPSATRRLLQGYDGDYHADIYPMIQQAADSCNVSVGDPTRERWYRMLTWVQYADYLSDSPVSKYPSQAVCQEAIRAIEPPQWRPTIAPFNDLSLAAYHWSRIVRSSFEGGDVSDERRERLAGVAGTLCMIGQSKMHSTSVRGYAATCRAEGMLVGDLFAECLSDTERHTTEADGFAQFLRDLFKFNIVLDSTVDYGSDIRDRRLLLPNTILPRLYLAAQAAGELGSVLVSSPIAALQAFTAKG